MKKPRSDSWDSRLSEEQRWIVYDKMRKFAWYDVRQFVAETYGENPSRSCLYAFYARMRKDESAHRIEQSITAAAEAGQLARVVATDEKLIAAYQSMAADIALRTGDAKTAERYTKMALNISENLRRGVLLERNTKAEKELTAAREEIADLKKQLSALRGELDSAHQKSTADPAAVAAEIDKHLGIKHNG